MQAVDIAALVSDRANNFGADNWQQVQYCASRLKNLPSEDVLTGLMTVFTEGAPPPAGSAAQELAGKLLIALAPSGDLNLESLLRKVLPRYELSVEQLPYHLANLIGKDKVYAATQTLEAERLTSTEHRALKTLQFWLRNQPSDA
ncbi:MAG: hypothetical protein EOO15_14095 [Chitinophagaceae bacterium]|nr:MAG: hypothetical protein EOO15_14095 [Chitinophagaceae bacterium]